MKSDGGVLRKTILTSDHFEGIYPIIILGTFSIILSPNVQCTINILQNGYLNLCNWLLITFAIVNIYFFQPFNIYAPRSPFLWMVGGWARPIQ